MKNNYSKRNGSSLCSTPCAALRRTPCAEIRYNFLIDPCAALRGLARDNFLIDILSNKFATTTTTTVLLLSLLLLGKVKVAQNVTGKIGKAGHTKRLLMILLMLSIRKPRYYYFYYYYYY